MQIKCPFASSRFAPKKLITCFHYFNSLIGVSKHSWLLTGHYILDFFSKWRIELRKLQSTSEKILTRCVFGIQPNINFRKTQYFRCLIRFWIRLWCPFRTHVLNEMFDVMSIWFSHQFARPQICYKGLIDLC